jgi:hypothetical protein
LKKETFSEMKELIDYFYHARLTLEKEKEIITLKIERLDNYIEEIGLQLKKELK